MNESNANKVRIINSEKIIAFYESIGFELGYETHKKSKYPVVKDLRNKVVYRNIDFMSNDHMALLYNSALFANHLMLDKGYINEEIKKVLDLQMYKYVNCIICLN